MERTKDEATCKHLHRTLDRVDNSENFPENKHQIISNHHCENNENTYCVHLRTNRTIALRTSRSKQRALPKLQAEINIIIISKLDLRTSKGRLAYG